MATIKHNEISVEGFMNAVFVCATVVILSSVIWGDKHDVEDYYQNLLITSFPIALTILHICHEIGDNKKRGFEPSTFISAVYNLSKTLATFCCVAVLCIPSMAHKSAFWKEHIECNKYWGICLITLIPLFYITFWGYVYPLLMDITYENKKIRLEERPE